jgi:hypothetical protein
MISAGTVHFTMVRQLQHIRRRKPQNRPGNAPALRGKTMFALLKPDAFWLIVANLVLGLVTVSLFAFLVVTVIRDLRVRSQRKKDEALVPDDYLSGLKDLGITLPDERPKIDEMEHQK